ncbi:MAG: hypothetical protein IIC08_05240, partial [Proteobacteria bacterium]|nr:hypothetical protein [Pseudomonadota bacterium]
MNLITHRLRGNLTMTRQSNEYQRPGAYLTLIAAFAFAFAGSGMAAAQQTVYLGGSGRLPVEINLGVIDTLLAPSRRPVVLDPPGRAPRSAFLLGTAPTSAAASLARPLVAPAATPTPLAAPEPKPAVAAIPKPVVTLPKLTVTAAPAATLPEPVAAPQPAPAARPSRLGPRLTDGLLRV